MKNFGYFLAFLAVSTIFLSAARAGDESPPLKSSPCTEELRGLAEAIGKNEDAPHGALIARALEKTAKCIDAGRIENIRGPIVADGFFHRKPAEQEGSHEE